MSSSRYSHQPLPPSSPERNRIVWLDGLRGVAAVQVVLLHYTSAWIPAIGLQHAGLARSALDKIFVGTPLFFPFDGATAVYVFFILSGVALTCSFSASPRTIVRNSLRRVIRLGLPMAAAILIGAGLYSLLPDAAALVSQTTGSSWLADIQPQHASPGSVLHQIAFEGMLIGYKYSSLIPSSLSDVFHTVPVQSSFDSPLWTLHYEFYGSLMVVLLMAAGAFLGRRVSLVLSAVLAIFLFATPLFPFIFGHIITPLIVKKQTFPLHYLGLVMLFSGIVLSTVLPLPDYFSTFRQLYKLPYFPLPASVVDLQKMSGALLQFSGIMLLPVVQRALDRPVAKWFGDISFGLYLVHYPILATVSSAVYLYVSNSSMHFIAVPLAFIVGIPLSFAAATVFQRWVDSPAVRLSRRISKFSLIGIR